MIGGACCEDGRSYAAPWIVLANEQFIFELLISVYNQNFGFRKKNMEIHSVS